MENLLDANQKEFVATIDNITRKGKVLVTKVNGNPLFVSLAYGKYSLPVGNGSNHDLITKGITNFRLLEPGEPESKEEKIDCPDCQGLGSTYLNKIQEECKRCGGVGLIKKEPTVSKEEAERHNVNPDKTFSEYDQETIRLFTEAARLLNCKLPDRSPLSKREKVATQLLAGMLGNHTIKGKEFRQILVTWAVEYADLLIEELNKKLGE